jgi:hypothetical protein
MHGYDSAATSGGTGLPLTSRTALPKRNPRLACPFSHSAHPLRNSTKFA